MLLQSWNFAGLLQHALILFYSTWKHTLIRNPSASATFSTRAVGEFSAADLVSTANCSAPRIQSVQVDSTILRVQLTERRHDATRPVVQHLHRSSRLHGVIMELSHHGFSTVNISAIRHVEKCHFVGGAARPGDGVWWSRTQFVVSWCCWRGATASMLLRRLD